MPLHVLAGPGCDSVAKLDYVEENREPDDVVISVGSLFKAVTGSDAIPSTNSAALRLAMHLRDEAIRTARTRELNGFVLTSNGSRAELDRLAQLAGGDVLILKMSKAEACARIAALVPQGERRAACELGIENRWFGRYRKADTDIEVET